MLDVNPPSVGIGERRFTYDAVFDSQVSQEELYNSVSKPLLGSFVDGYNATVSQANRLYIYIHICLEYLYQTYNNLYLHSLMYYR